MILLSPHYIPNVLHSEERETLNMKSLPPNHMIKMINDQQIFIISCGETISRSS
jgi:hypothetical protein